MKILIADDDLISRRLLKKTLEDWGHEVLAVENGREAWDNLQKSDAKFVIIDRMMPLIDGITLCRKIRLSKVSGYIYIILLTSMGRKEDIIEGLKAGADDYIIKPFDRDELNVRVRTGVRILNLEKELIEKNEKLEILNINLEKLVRLDPLMEIGNRRNFYESIEKIHLRASRYKDCYGIIMCDIDNFKFYNDTYGHLSGDSVLKMVADSIKHTLRKSDDIFRYGGEEIVILLPEQNRENTVLTAERIRKDIEGLNIVLKSDTKGILTISCGVMVFNKENIETKWETILDFADKALYKAKSNGRNQVFAY